MKRKLRYTHCGRKKRHCRHIKQTKRHYKPRKHKNTTNRVCIRIPKKMLNELKKIDTSTNTQSYKIRKAIREYVEKETDRILEKYKK